MGCVFMNIIFPYHIIPLAVHELSMRIQHFSSRGLSHSSRDVFEMSLIQSHEFVELLSSKRLTRGCHRNAVVQGWGRHRDKGFVECSRRKKGGLENRGWRNLSMERKIEQIVAPLFEASQGRLSSSEIVPHLLLLCYPWVSTCTPRSGREPLGLLCPLWEQFCAMADVADPALGLALLWGPPWPEKVLCWTQA